MLDLIVKSATNLPHFVQFSNILDPDTTTMINSNIINQTGLAYLRYSLAMVTLGVLGTYFFYANEIL